MKLIEFREFTEGIYKYFRYAKLPTAEEIEAWLPEVEFIPSAALPWITQSLKSGRTNLSRNFPRELKNEWNKYLDAHPEKISKVEENPDYDCPDCHGVGVLHFRAEDLTKKTEIKYLYAALCASCRASWKKFGKIAHEGGKVSIKSESGAWIPSGTYIAPMSRYTKAQILELGYDFKPAENKYKECDYDPGQAPPYRERIKKMGLFNRF